MTAKRHAGAERRKGFRKSLAFGTDIVQINTISLKRKWDDEVGVNIGPNGFCCCSTKQLPAGASVICLILFRPPNDRQVVEADAKLVWQKSRKVEGEQLWYHGFEFTKVNSPHRKLIDQALKEPEEALAAT